MPQSTMTDAQGLGFAGEIADSTIVKQTDSFVNEEASAEIPFGVMAIHGTNDGDAKLMTANTELPAGIVLHSHRYAKDEELGSTGLKPDVSMNLLQKGRILVTAVDAVTPADPVRYIVAGGGFQTASAGVGASVDISLFARWITSAGAGELAVLEIDMTGRGHRVND